MKLEQHYTAEQIAQRLAVCVETVRRYNRDGWLKDSGISERPKKYTDKNIEDFIKARRDSL